MEFQEEEIRKLAKLSRISLSDHDVEKFREQLSSILAYVDQITSVSVDDATETSSNESVLRADITKKSEVTRKTLLDAAPATEEGHVSSLKVK